MPGHAAGIAPPYDPDRARELLDAAGYPGGAGFPAVDLISHGMFHVAGQYLRDQWRENLGIDVARIETKMDWAEYLDVFDSRQAHLRLMGWAADYPDSDNFLRVAVQHAAPWYPAHTLHWLSAPDVPPTRRIG
jgi:ABC-type oligopeptide transport system substrate-binding subunit